jgi:DME family drug/metabolite transporter
MENGELTGIALGLSTAWVWATSSLWIKSLSGRIHPISFNAFRMVVAALFFLAVFPFVGGWEALAQLSTSYRIALAASNIIGVAFGDMIYFWSISKIGASRAMPISGIYPLFTWLIAVPLLGEPVTVRAIVGTVLVLVSLYLLAPPAEAQTEAKGDINRAGVLAAIVAAALWAVATTALKFGLRDGANVFVVNAFRLPIGALVGLGIVRVLRIKDPWDGITRTNFKDLIAVSLYGTVLGAITWVLAVDYAGAARAALINTTSPLIGVPLSVFFLHERVTPRTGVGALLSVIGVAMIL